MAFGFHVSDDIGRCFCKDHRREVCDKCCLAFDIPNRMAEERAGLRKPKTQVEEAAEDWAVATFALQGMEQMHPRPTEAVFAQNNELLREADEKLKRFQEAEQDVRGAMERALDNLPMHQVNRDALVQAWSKQNPGKPNFEVGGKETQELYDQFVAGPSAKDNRAEKSTCNYCNSTSTKKLMLCVRCRKVSYCNRNCQKAAWKAHKLQCKPLDPAVKDPKTLNLTWDEVEAYQGAPAQGRTLEVKAVLDESMMRQVIACKDRVGAVRRIAAYTNSRRIPGLKQGSILSWKNPRFHYFMDGSSGARIEEEDLPNVTVL
jgi:hypothetical protein